VVYIEEAHPIDAWQDDDNIKAKIFLHSTRTLAERCAVAGTCLTKLGIEFPAIVDDEANAAERAYTAWPDRLYVIDRDGRVAYKSKPGPFGFKPAEVARTLERLLPGSQAAVAAPSSEPRAE
jgi:Iodothyronine deiodinase